jgi:hypothetical protein
MVVFLLFGVVFVGIGLLCCAGGARKLYNATVIWRNDPVSVQEAARQTGTDEFEGTVRAIDDDHRVDAPFAGEAAVLLNYEVTKREQSGDNSRQVTVDSGEIRQPFLVEDASGCVEVDPSDADLSIGKSVVDREDEALADGVRLRLSVLTDEYDLGSILPQATTKTRHFKEGHVAPGDSVHVYGTTATEATPTASRADCLVTGSDTSNLYQISVEDESAAVRQNLLTGTGYLLAGLLFGGLGLIPLGIGLSAWVQLLPV